MCLLLMEKYRLCFSFVRGKPINIEPFINTIQFLDNSFKQKIYILCMKLKTWRITLDLRANS